MRRLFVLPALLIVAGLVLSGCASKNSKHASLDPFAGKGSPYYKGKGPIPMGGGNHVVGKPYQVAGHWFTPKEQPNYDKQGVASWYGEAFHRRKTSNGEWFDMNQLTAAVITTSPFTVASQRKRCAATRPGAIGPIGLSIG